MSPTTLSTENETAVGLLLGTHGSGSRTCFGAVRLTCKQRASLNDTNATNHDDANARSYARSALRAPPGETQVTSQYEAYQISARVSTILDRWFSASCNGRGRVLELETLIHVCVVYRNCNPQGCCSHAVAG